MALLAAAACLLVLRGATAFKELHHVEKSLKSEPSLIVGYDDARIRLMKYKKISRIDQDIITKLLSSNETTTATKAPTARLFSLKSKYTKEGNSSYNNAKRAKRCSSIICVPLYAARPIANQSGQLPKHRAQGDSSARENAQD